MRFSISLATAPLYYIQTIIDEIERSSIEMIHFDVESGHFFSPITLGTKLIKDLRPFSSKIFDVHLMMTNSEKIIADIASWGVDRICIHLENCVFPKRILRMIKESGCEAGLAINPITPIPDLTYLVPFLDYVLISSSEPETKEEANFLPQVLEKISKSRNIPDLMNIEWIVDGGINSGNVQEVRDCGADGCVIGRALLNDMHIIKNERVLRRLIDS